MSPSALAPPAATGQWPQQRALLERQHARLEQALKSVIGSHRATASELDAQREQRQQRDCQRLLKDLRLHLRLEERWLQQHGCLCGGHRDAHQRTARQATADLQAAGEHPQRRLQVLEGIQQWFDQHRHGPDAMAYALASHRSSNSTSTQHDAP